MSFNPIGEIKKWFNRVKREAESGIKKIKNEANSAVNRVKREADTAKNKATSEINHIVNDTEKELKNVGSDIEQHLHEIGEDIADGLQKGFGDLVELAEQGALEPALDKIASYAEHAVFDGSAPIPLRTAYLDIELTDAKRLARTIRDMIQNGIPTTKSQWRHIIVDLAPVAVTIKPGVPLIAQLVNRIPLKNLEREALDKILQEAGLR